MFCRPIQPKALNSFHVALCTILSFVGAFFAVVLSNAMYIEYYTSFPSTRRYWQVIKTLLYTLRCIALYAVYKSLHT